VRQAILAALASVCTACPPGKPVPQAETYSGGQAVAHSEGPAGGLGELEAVLGGRHAHDPLENGAEVAFAGEAADAAARAEPAEPTEDPAPWGNSEVDAEDVLEPRTKSKYPVLATIADLYRLLAVVVFVAAVVGPICILLQAGHEGPNGAQIWAAVALGLWCAMSGLALLAVAESICLAIDVESNTRTTNDLLRHLIDSKNAKR